MSDIKKPTTRKGATSVNGERLKAPLKTPVVPTSWWDAVRSVADLVAREGLDPSEDGVIKLELQSMGYGALAIEEAMNWLDQAHNSGHLLDTLSMLAGLSGRGVRVADPMERLFMSDKVWHELANYQRRGLVSHDMAERILEGMRVLDTRDWDDEEVRNFIADIVAAGKNIESGKMIQKLMKGPNPRLYS